ncbi:MAG: hypothetical protein PSX81_00555 [bacterium]|nr:hypothetical protein [bacterium]
MEEENGKIFRMKKGFCHLLSDRIVFSTRATVAGITNDNAHSNLIRFRIVYLLLSLVYFYMSYSSYMDQKYFFTAFFAIFLLLNMTAIIQSWKYTAVNVIDKTSIVSIQFFRGINYLTRSRFNVTYTDEKGQVKQRLILMPGSLTGGAQATDKALELMIEEGLIEAKQY